MTNSHKLAEIGQPPIVDSVIGAGFAPLIEFTKGHASWFWRDSLGVGHEIQQGWAPIVTSLQQILLLGEDWDGGGAEKPDPKVIAFCFQLSQVLADQGFVPASHVSPTVEGGAVFQWQHGCVRLELECNEPNRIELMFSVPGQRPKQEVILL